MQQPIPDKSNIQKSLLKHLGWQGTCRAVILDRTTDADTKRVLAEAAKALDVCLVDTWDEVYGPGYDAVVSDELSLGNLAQCIAECAIVPILPVTQEYGKKLENFNPMKFSGNAFLYKNTSVYGMLEQVFRFLENMRYPGDRRVLLKNVSATKL